MRRNFKTTPLANGDFAVITSKLRGELQGFTFEFKIDADEKAAALTAKWHLEQALKAMENAGDGESNFELIRNAAFGVKDKVDTMHKTQSDYDEIDPCTWM